MNIGRTAEEGRAGEEGGEGEGEGEGGRGGEVVEGASCTILRRICVSYFLKEDKQNPISPPKKNVNNNNDNNELQ